MLWTLDVGLTGLIGQPVPMLDAHDRVTGRAPFVANFELPGMLHGKLLRSPVAHGRLVNVDASRAARLRGVAAVVTGADLADERISPRFGPVFPDRPIVAVDKVRYAGEPVAMVAASDEDTALEALQLIDVEYEELPALVTPEEALGPDAPAIHDQVLTREFITYPDIVINLGAGKNIFNHYKLRKGDVEAGFAQSDHVFEHQFTTPHQQHCSLEPHITVARMEGERITLWSSCSSPFTARFQVAETLKIPQSKVRVIVFNIGGAYGGKTYPRLEPLVAVLCWKLGGRAVKVELDRSEEFYTVTRHASRVSLKTGVTRDGKLLARKAEILWGAGAYADVSPRLIKNGGFAVPGPYLVPNVWVDSYAVYTNTTPSGGFRGYAIPQVTWAGETQIDIICRELGWDPFEFRQRNALKDGDAFSTGQVCHDMHYPELLERVVVGMGWEWPRLQSQPHSGPTTSGPGLGTWDLGPGTSDLGLGTWNLGLGTGNSELGTRRGRGLAMAVKGTVTPSTSTASVRLAEDGSATVLTSTTEVGQGSRTVLAQIGADELRVPLEQVSVSSPDTDYTPWDQTTSSSRSTFMMGSAVREAARSVRDQLLALAGLQLEAALSDLVAEGGRVFVRGVPERSVNYSDVVRKSRQGNLLGSGVFQTEGELDPETGLGVATCHFHQAAAGAQVEVDTETGQVDVLKLHLETYAGQVINPTLASLQNEGNIAFGIGQALMEEVVFEGGKIVNPNLADYMVPSFADMPPGVSTGLLEDPSGDGEVHGLGETGAPPVPAAVGNAIYDAVGVRIMDLPITPEKVLRALHARALSPGPSGSQA